MVNPPRVSTGELQVLDSFFPQDSSYSDGYSSDAGSLIQIAALLAQFLALPFSAFALSFALGGIGMVFQVGIICIYI